MEERKRRKEANKPGSEGGHQTTSRNHAVPHIRKTILRKAIPYILVGCIVSSSVMMSYNEVEEVKAEAISITALTVCALLAVMATMGITYATQSILETWEGGNNALDPDYEDIYETWKDDYDTEWKVLEGGGDNNDDLPPDFETLIKQVEIAGNTAVITAGAWNLLKKSGKNLLQKSYELGTLFADATIPNGINVPIEDISKNTSAIIHIKDGRSAIVYSDLPICFSDENLYLITCDGFRNRVNYYNDKGILVTENIDSPFGHIRDVFSHNNFTIWRSEVYKYDSHISKYTTFNTEEEAINYLKQFEDSSNIASSHDEPIWVTPELQETYENNGQFEFPENLPSPLRVPNISDLQELAQRLNPDSNPDYNPEEVPDYIKQYINDLKADPTPDPNPNPDPDNPDKPDIPDTPDNPTNNDTFLADLKHLFPFCIPFDLVDCFKLFNAEPVTPRVEFPVHFGIINYEHTFVIDLKDFNNVAVVCRSTFLIVYMIGLILATRALIKG